MSGNRWTIARVVAVMSVLLSAGFAQTPNTEWFNTEDDTFTISSADELAGLARLVNNGNDFNGKTVTLSNDIDIAAYGKGASEWNSGKGWIPIGNTSSATFRGIFEGSNNKISNLFINSTVTIQIPLDCLAILATAAVCGI